MIFWLLVVWFANDFHSWLRQSWISLTSHLTRDHKIIIDGNSSIILYVTFAILVWEVCGVFGGNELCHDDIW